MGELAQRQALILRGVVIEHVSTAEPVASELITLKYNLGVRAATVRNELAELADRGFVEQPHTSAGRVPSDRGYRYFVEHFVADTDPEADSKRQVKKAAREGEALQDLMRDTAKVLSRLTQLLIAATTVRNASCRVRHATVSALGPDSALLILVLSNGHVENRLIECPEALTLDEIGQVNDKLAELTTGCTLRSLTRLRVPLPPKPRPAEALLASAVTSLRAVAKDLTRGKLITAGEEYIFTQPEFVRDTELPGELIRWLQDEERLLKAVHAPSDEPVTIGTENPDPGLHHFSILRQSVKVGDDEAGLLAIIGPTRMQYESNLALLRFTARALGDTLSRALGHEPRPSPSGSLPR